MIEQAIKVEAKAGFLPAFYIREIDHQTLQSNRLAHITAAKIQTQSTIIKDPRIKKLKKTQEPKPVNNSSNNVETSEKA